MCLDETVPQTVQHFLEIYQLRKSMQDDGVTNPSESIKRFTADFVQALKKHDPNELVEIVKPGNGIKQFILVSNGIVLAELPEVKNT